MDANKTGKKLSRCPSCGHTPLREETITDRFQYGSDEDGPVTIEVPNVPIEVCDNCGERYLGPGAARAQHLAVCRALRLLTPDEIRAIRERFGPTQAEFARLTGIGEATISRWERGRMPPNRAMDYYLRLLDAKPENVIFLRQLAVKKNGAKEREPDKGRWRCLQETDQLRKRAAEFEPIPGMGGPVASEEPAAAERK